MITATEVEKIEAQEGQPLWSGFVKLYKLSEKITTIPAIDGAPMTSADHIIISGVGYVSGLPTLETYIFPSDDQGIALDMVQLAGSIDGQIDFDQALENFLAHYNREETDG